SEENAALWNISSGTPLSPPLANPDHPNGAFFSPDGGLLAVYGGNWLTVWDLTTYRTAFPPLTDLSQFLTYAEFSPDGSMLVICERDNDFSHLPTAIYDAHTGRKISGFKLRDGALCAGFSHNSKKVVTGGEDFTAYIFDPRTGNPLASPLR